MKQLEKLHGDFDYYYDKEKMKDKISSKWYDPEFLDNQEDLMFSTDWTFSEEDVAYRRYKLLTQESKLSIKKYKDIINILQLQVDKNIMGV